jgi:hypothetical protein
MSLQAYNHSKSSIYGNFDLVFSLGSFLEAEKKKEKPLTAATGNKEEENLEL